MELHTLVKVKGNKSKGKRRGRGIGSGKGGHTVGFGTKGQKARSGNSIPFGFEGGQVPLFKKLPQMGGFKSKRLKPVAVPLVVFESFTANSVVTPEDLVKKGILQRPPRKGIKVIATGDLTKKLTLKGFLMTAGAKEKLQELGCKIEN